MNMTWLETDGTGQDDTSIATSKLLSRQTNC